MVLLKLNFIQGLSTQPRVNFRDRDTGAPSFLDTLLQLNVLGK